MSDNDRQDLPDPEVSSGGSPDEEASGQGPDMTAFEESFGDESQLAQTVAELEEANDALARSRADVYNLNQEYSNFVRRAKTDANVQRKEGQIEVIEALLGVLDDLDAARQAGALDGSPFGSIAAKLEEVLATHFGLERYGVPGEEFDPRIHEALMAQTNPEVDHPVVKQVLQPGYRVKERVIRATKVMVDNPE